MSNDTMAYKCELCEELFHRRDNLKRHRDSVHTKSSNLQCDVCFKLFSRKDSLRRHIKTHATKMNEKVDQLKNVFSDVSNATYPVQSDTIELSDQTLSARATELVSDENSIRKTLKDVKRKRGNSGETEEKKSVIKAAQNV
ncbi:Transcriptional regulator MNL1 [Holothuria leucospilota]|uniref:Transcriptional regulator MNL1 n=1 Tax=Holothuria leucospilota TaxID=206669 RepID=A0A9Q1CPV9_HOLLE|nr:Transcriptional regulator MNL1 [Holothuria leucospilota]